jgi:hypothetical protein
MTVLQLNPTILAQIRRRLARISQNHLVPTADEGLMVDWLISS